MKLIKLPGWVKDDAASVREEVAPYLSATPEELWRHTRDCASDAMWAIRASDVGERALLFEDPLPENSRVALSRLRQGRKRT